MSRKPNVESEVISDFTPVSGLWDKVRESKSQPARSFWSRAAIQAFSPSAAQ